MYTVTPSLAWSAPLVLSRLVHGHSTDPTTATQLTLSNFSNQFTTTVEYLTFYNKLNLIYLDEKGDWHLKFFRQVRPLHRTLMAWPVLVKFWLGGAFLTIFQDPPTFVPSSLYRINPNFATDMNYECNIDDIFEPMNRILNEKFEFP